MLGLRPFLVRQSDRQYACQEQIGLGDRCTVALVKCMMQFSSRYASCDLQVRPKVQLPTMSQLTELSNTFGPASLIYIFKSLCYMMLQVSFCNAAYPCDHDIAARVQFSSLCM